MAILSQLESRKHEADAAMSVAAYQMKAHTMRTLCRCWIVRYTGHPLVEMQSRCSREMQHGHGSTGTHRHDAFVSDIQALQQRRRGDGTAYNDKGKQGTIYKVRTRICC